jgi:hypothetical protein
MWKVFKINFLIFFTLIFFLEVFLISLNFIFDGVPLYRQFNLSEDQIISYKQKKSKKKNFGLLDNFYLEHFKGYNKKSYLDEYLKQNKTTLDSIRWMKGSDINFPIYFDKNNCRENNDSSYINSDLVLIGDSSLFGYSIASPFDIAGRLRELYPNKKILNLGIPGSGPLAQVNHLKRLTIDTSFENIVWFFVEANDYSDFGSDANCGYSHNEPTSLERKYDNTNTNFLGLKIFFAEHFRGLASFAKLFISYDDKFNLDKSHYENTVKELVKYLDQKNIKNKYLYFLPYYNRHSYKNDFFVHPNVKKLNILKKDVKDIVTKYGFVFIDGNDAVKHIKHKKKLYHYEYQTHYNAKGYTLTADHLSKFLELN